MLLHVDFHIDHRDVDLLTEFTAKLEARYEATYGAPAPVVVEQPTEPPVAESLATEVVVTPAPEVSDEVATDALHKYVAKKGPAAAITLFAEYGAKRLGDVPSDRRAELVARMNEAMA